LCTTIENVLNRWRQNPGNISIVGICDGM